MLIRSVRPGNISEPPSNLASEMPRGTIQLLPAVFIAAGHVPPTAGYITIRGERKLRDAWLTDAGVNLILRGFRCSCLS